MPEVAATARRASRLVPSAALIVNSLSISPSADSHFPERPDQATMVRKKASDPPVTSNAKYRPPVNESVFKTSSSRFRRNVERVSLATPDDSPLTTRRRWPDQAIFTAAFPVGRGFA